MLRRQTESLFFFYCGADGGGGAYSGSCCINHTCLTLKVIRVIWFSLNASGLHLFFSPMKILMGNSFWLDKSYQETSAASLYSIGNTASLHFDSRHSCRQITQKSCSPFSMTVAFWGTELHTCFKSQSELGAAGPQLFTWSRSRGVQTEAKQGPHCII